MAQNAGEASPDGRQRLLRRAGRDIDAGRAVRAGRAEGTSQLRRSHGGGCGAARRVKPRRAAS
ncbi:hypothetical protein Acy02nite_76830 [Actinoplanes cyaneus]|uniref:Uncharacterized protein n=1 Tax=Actinoplanes cyaneus TaxID=52696 RepID=A0A919M8G8_9ACTN|nr:hypothetical protein Acy02nite_76830 [Actinoplanes cyaneus]